MVSSILKQAAEILRRQKESKQWRKVFLCLAVAVTATTITILMMTGQALTRQPNILNCQLEVHEHSDDCYDEDDNLICGYADYVVHVHNDSCYDSEKNLICALPEREIHEHTDDCYEEQEVLICEITEAAETDADTSRTVAVEADTAKIDAAKEDTAKAAGHTHTDACYTTEQGGLVCDMEEHTHGDGCYDESLVCDLREHSHDDGCYDEEGEMTCEKDEHDHDGGCYEQTFACEAAEHTHTDDCYEQTRTLTCTIEESSGSSESAEKEKEESRPADTDTDTDTNAAEHIHTDDCYETEEVLTCGELELHTHEQSLVEDGGCYDEDAFDSETGDFIEGSLPVCGLLQLEEHIHGEECFLPAEDDVVPAEYTKTFEGDGFRVTAVYTTAANIPEEAELIAEQITADSDEEHYAQREAQYRETVENETASMWALLKIGFYVEDEENGGQKEVEPEDSVTITVQMLDEEGMPEGAPVTVVHFGEEDPEVLDGGLVENGSTTFQIDSFSEIAIGYCSDGDGDVYISQSFLYEDDSYHIVFRVEGTATAAEGEEPLPDNVTDIISEELRPVSIIGNSASEEPSDEEETEVPDDEAQESADVEETEAPDEETQEPADEEEQEVPDEEAQEPSSEEESEVPDEEELLSADRVQFCLEQMREDSEEYTAYAAFTQDKEDGSQQLNFQVMKYSMTYDDIPLDLSDCKITAEIRPTQTLIEYAKNGLAEAMSSPEDEAPEGQNQELMLSALQMTDGVAAEVEVLSSAAIQSVSEDAEDASDDDGTEKSNTIIVNLGDKGTFALDLTGTPNPHFSVQYYAWLDRAELITEIPTNSTADYLGLIDTSAAANNTKDAKLPVNGKTPKTAYLELDEEGKVKTERTLTKIYSDRTGFEYYKQPTIEYLNAVIVNRHYELSEIWVLKDGKEADSTDEDDWEIYTYSEENLHLTNKKREGDTIAVEGSDSGYICIEDEAVLRLVYNTSAEGNDFAAAFYDYDISTGRVHRAKPPEDPNQYVYMTAGQTFSGDNLTTGVNGVLDWAAGLSGWDGHLYAYTKEQGINSSGNYSGSGTKLAFGNVNTGTNLGRLTWSNAGKNNELNKYNNSSYQGCTFGLVTGMSGDKIQYASGIQAPKLFNEGDATGKTSYDKGQYSLNFNRVGDTYTLSAVNGTGASNLESFSNPTNSTGTHTDIWTNNFWPMDSADSFGTGTHDVKFGGTATFKGGTHEIRFGPITQKDKDYTFPESDDGKYHNSYFGMNFTVPFQLVKDYEGPLEYYFFGDDDMWVFLDGQLVCDIGGVHSSVGEYVDLWDYLEVNTSATPQDHTLSFFYTERGASGSTCWMQFTLPSVSSLTPETTSKNYGELRIEKAVTRKDPDGTVSSYDTEDEFIFAILLTDENGDKVLDDYAYTKYDADGKVLTGSDGYGLVVRNGSAFTLKNGQYIVIDHLRAGTQYTVMELDKILEDLEKEKLANSHYVYDTSISITNMIPDENGNKVAAGKPTVVEGTTATGAIPEGGQSQVEYTNEFRAYALPKTGGMGTAGYMRTGALLVFIAVISCFGYKKRRSIRGEE